MWSGKRCWISSMNSFGELIPVRPVEEDEKDDDNDDESMLSGDVDRSRDQR